MNGEKLLQIFFLTILLYLILRFSRQANNIANAIANGVNGSLLALQGRDNSTGSQLIGGLGMSSGGYYA